MAVLNSPLLNCYLKETGTALRGGYFRMKTAYLNPFPVPKIDLSSASEKAKYDQVLSLVDQMMELFQKSKKAKIGNEILQRQIDSVGKEINHLIFALYDLAEEEIKSVESELS